MTPVTVGAGWPPSESRREGLEPRSGDPRDRRASLKDVLDQAGSLPLPAALLLLDDVLEVLEKKQATGTVHGEVSLSGMSVDELGHCHVRTDDQHSAAYVAGRGGTHRYAAPEVRRGGSVTATADAYAATAVFAEAVTGLPPDVARDVITTDSPGSATVPENPVPLSVRRLVDMGMAADEARRPTNAAVLRDALSTASTAAFPMVDWQARGRAWLAAAAATAASERRATPAAVATPFRIPAATPSVAGSAAGSASTAAAAATSAPAPTPLPWQSQVPSYAPTPRPRYDWEDDRLPALPGFFRRLGRGDPGIVSGCGLSVIGFILLLIGATVGLNMSGPNNASAAQPTAGISAQNNSSDNGGLTTPPAVGSSLAPGVAGSEQISPSPGPTTASSASPSPVPSPTDTGAPSFTPYPTFSPPPTPAPTPSCFLLC
jgi:serine/threonine-protein kinase